MMKIQLQLEQAQTASRSLNLVDSAQIDRVLLALADAAEQQCEAIIAANAHDLAQMEPTNPLYDRLLLTPQRVKGIAEDIRNVASLPSPLDRVLSQDERPNGMKITKLTVPFGVIGVIYEARPNVSFDVFSLCLKAGSASVLKGGSDARHSNEAIVSIIREVLRSHGMDDHLITLLPVDRETTGELLEAVGYVDLLIPRGSKGLIEYVRNHARIAVIETGAGICHTYFDHSGDLEQCAAIVLNAKTRRVSVCNALDCLVVHHERLSELPRVCEQLAAYQVVIYADPASFKALWGHYPAALLQPATEDSFGTEFLDYKMSIRTVNSTAEAIAHITRHSSKHSEAIVSEDAYSIARFQRGVDAACVYVNVSTAFTDGAQFGLGAEIGISTQKLHARGPMGLHELTTYKYLITGEGQVRP